MSDFAEKLSTLMTDQRVSQSELSRRAGVAQTTISDYLRRVTRPSWSQVQAISKALGVSTDALVDDPPDPAPLPPVARIVSKRK